MEQDPVGKQIFERATNGFLHTFSLTDEALTPEERSKIEELERQIAGLRHQIAQLDDAELVIRKEVLIRNGLAATSLDLLLTAKGDYFSAKRINHDPFTHVEKHQETAYYCDSCRLWVKGKPKTKIFVSEGVAAYQYLVADHPMGKGLFPFEM
jgi:hypothetical protein